MKRSVRFIGLLIALCGLSACSNEAPINEGVVTGKSHRSAYTTFVPIFNGKTTTLIPQFHAEEWIITIANDSASQRHYVSENVYDSAVVGEYIKLRADKE